MPISLWSHNFPTLQATDKLNDLTFKIDKFTINGTGKIEQVFTFKENKAIRFNKQHILGNFVVPELICSNKRNQLIISIKLDPSYLNQIYLFRGSNPTFEWMTRKIITEPQQSWSTWMQLSMSKEKLKD